jgi:hypothetical protein
MPSTKTTAESDKSESAISMVTSDDMLVPTRSESSPVSPDCEILTTRGTPGSVKTKDDRATLLG